MSATDTPRRSIKDTFNGDNEHLRASIKALINLNDDDALVPHGIGGHARELLASSYHRISQLERELAEAKAAYRGSEELALKFLKANETDINSLYEQLTTQRAALEKANKLLHAFEAAQRPHGSDRFGNACECDQCQAWDQIESALTTINAALGEKK